MSSAHVRLVLGEKARRVRRVQYYGNIGHVKGSRKRAVGSDGETEATVRMLQKHLQTQGCVNSWHGCMETTNFKKRH